MCVCCTHLFSLFFPPAFVLVNDLSLVSRCFYFGNAYDFVFVAGFVFVFVFCCMHLYFYGHVLLDVLSLMFFHVAQ